MALLLPVFVGRLALALDVALLAVAPVASQGTADAAALALPAVQAALG